jgi:hypothetical protein
VGRQVFMSNDNSCEPIHRWLEYAVPLLSFGGALLGIFFWVTNASVDYWISILGCVFASWVLAYLAWMRPKRDIVALSTPIYSLIFLAVPTDNFSAVVLEVLYAVSLSILLIRLKYRFGAQAVKKPDKKELVDPVKTYVEKVREPLIATTPGLAHGAALAFVRFAEGEFSEAASASTDVIKGPNDGEPAPCLKHAFEIVEEQAARLDQSLPAPEKFRMFSPEDARVLAKVPDPKFGKPEEYDTALENALLLLYATAWNAESDRPHLLQCQDFAQRLLGK